MNKIRSTITKVELSRAYDEGKQAFEENRRRGYNPYAVTKQELAMAWWHGWDTAQEETNGKRSPTDEHTR